MATLRSSGHTAQVAFGKANQMWAAHRADLLQ